MPTKTTGLRELAERVFAASPGDSLGLRYDLEAQLLLIDGMFEEFVQAPDPKRLAQWRELVEGIEQNFELSAQSPELRARFHTHRLMLDFLKKAVGRRASKRHPRLTWSSRPISRSVVKASKKIRREREAEDANDGELSKVDIREAGRRARD